MTDTRRVVRVFLASPGDLAEERKAAKAVVEDLNSLMADEFGYHVELVGWEDTVSLYGRPQAVINRDLERCEYFIGMMWRRWGTPPDSSGQYSSGFEEEYETSILRRGREGKPEISLLFKHVEAEFLKDPGEDLRKVLAFKEKLISEKKILFETFSDTRDFESKFRRCVFRYVSRLRAHDKEEASAKSQTPTTEGEKPQAVDSAATSQSPLGAQGSQFLRSLVSKADSGADHVSAVEIARFRLLASLMGRSGNDERTLGVHDANLIYSHADQVDLGRPELNGLVAVGLRNLSNENIPLWRWFAAMDGFAKGYLPVYAVMKSDEKRQAGALTAMTLIREPLPKSRRQFTDFWFSSDSSSAVRVLALNYLAACGTDADLPVVRKEFGRNDNQTVNVAAEAIICISLRIDHERATSALFDLQPSSLKDSTLKSLFAAIDNADVGILQKGVGHRNDGVRRLIVQALRKRGALTIELAERLVKDEDPRVRYEALLWLTDNGRTVTDDQAKRILIRTSQQGGLGVLAARPTWDAQGEQLWEKFKDQRRRSMKEKDLEAAASAGLLMNYEAVFALAERRFEDRGGELRSGLSDLFKTMFESELQRLAQKHAGTDLADRFKGLEEHFRKQLTRGALNIICRRSDARDLELVRSVVKSGYIDYSSSEIEYLRKFGTFEDVSTIIAVTQRPEVGGRWSIFSDVDASKYRTGAKALYTLGHKKLASVLTTKMPSGLLAHLIVEIPVRQLKKLNNEIILGLLHSDSDEVRKAAALKCVQGLPKSRVLGILKAYMSGTRAYYYNVIHWLDMGIWVPRNRLLSAVDDAMRQWQDASREL